MTDEDIFGFYPVFLKLRRLLFGICSVLEGGSLTLITGSGSSLTTRPMVSSLPKSPPPIGLSPIEEECWGCIIEV